MRTDEIFTERICPALRREVVTLRHDLTNVLSNFWKSFIALQDLDGQVLSFQIPSSSSDAVSEVLTLFDPF